MSLIESERTNGQTVKIRIPKGDTLNKIALLAFRGILAACMVTLAAAVTVGKEHVISELSRVFVTRLEFSTDQIRQDAQFRELAGDSKQAGRDREEMLQRLSRIEGLLANYPVRRKSDGDALP